MDLTGKAVPNMLQTTGSRAVSGREPSADSVLMRGLVSIVGEENVSSTDAQRMVYEADGFTMARRRPAAVVHPASTEEVQSIVRLAARLGVPFVARGAGTGLSGGAMAPPGGIVISLTRMRRILDIDLRNRRLTAEAGVVNLKVTQAVAPHGLHYAPDPSSQSACTLGGNVAENAGGPHTLKYGVTVNHLLGLKMVLPDGEILDVPGETEDNPGYDLPGLITGSEGTLGIVTEVTVRLTPLPQKTWTALAVFETVSQATRCVSAIIAAGIIPAALELMDANVIQAVEAAFHFGLPLDAQAVLIIELDGLEAGLDGLGQKVRGICEEHGVRELRVARDEQERTALWMCRKKAVGSLGRLAPSHCTQDCVIPRSALPEVLEKIGEIARRFDLRIANVFHAGDGNLHPIVLYDDRDEEQVRRVLECNGEIVRACVEAGGTITGEHGVGVEKLEFMPLIFSDTDLATMERVRAAFDPAGLCNPGKLLPGGDGRAELVLNKKAAI